MDTNPRDFLRAEEDMDWFHQPAGLSFAYLRDLHGQRGAGQPGCLNYALFASEGKYRVGPGQDQHAAVPRSLIFHGAFLDRTCSGVGGVT